MNTNAMLKLLTVVLAAVCLYCPQSQAQSQAPCFPIQELVGGKFEQKTYVRPHPPGRKHEYYNGKGRQESEPSTFIPRNQACLGISVAVTDGMGDEDNELNQQGYWDGKLTGSLFIFLYTETWLQDDGEYKKGTKHGRPFGTWIPDWQWHSARYPAIRMFFPTVDGNYHLNDGSIPQ